MAKRTEENKDLGTSAPVEATGADAVATDQSTSKSGEREDGNYEVHFNRSTALGSYVTEDGDEVANGDTVSKEVFDKLANVKIDGYDLIEKEDS